MNITKSMVIKAAKKRGLKGGSTRQLIGQVSALAARLATAGKNLDQSETPIGKDVIYAYRNEIKQFSSLAPWLPSFEGRLRGRWGSEIRDLQGYVDMALRDLTGALKENYAEIPTPRRVARLQSYFLTSAARQLHYLVRGLNRMMVREDELSTY